MKSQGLVVFETTFDQLKAKHRTVGAGICPEIAMNNSSDTFQELEVVILSNVGHERMKHIIYVIVFFKKQRVFCERSVPIMYLVALAKRFSEVIDTIVPIFLKIPQAIFFNQFFNKNFHLDFLQLNNQSVEGVIPYYTLFLYHIWK